MLDVFKARLKAKSTAAGANLSQKRIDVLSDRLNLKFPDLKEEAEHDTKIDDLYDAEMFKDFAAVDDYQRAKDAREKKEKADKDKSDKDKKEAETKDDPKDDTPEWAKALIEQNKALAEKVQNIEKEKTFGSIKQKISEGLKEVPEKLWSRMKLPENEDEVETFITEVKQDWIDAGLAGQQRPGGGSGGGPNNKATPAEIKNITDKIIK